MNIFRTLLVVSLRGEAGGRRSGGPLHVGALSDLLPGGALHVLSWLFRAVRRAVRASLGGEVLPFVDLSELLMHVNHFYENVFGGEVPSVVATVCKSLVSHLREGAPRDGTITQSPLFAT